MEQITVFARVDLKPENLEQVKALAAQRCRTAADEPGTLTYGFHYSPEHGSLVILMTYADSAACLAHMQADGHGEFMGSLMELIDLVDYVVIGEPTPELAAAMSNVPGAQLYSEVASI